MVVFQLSTFQKKLKSLLAIKILKHNHQMQAYNWMMRGHFFVGFIDFMFKGKSSKNFTYLFSPGNFENNDKVY